MTEQENIQAENTHHSFTSDQYREAKQLWGGGATPKRRRKRVGEPKDAVMSNARDPQLLGNVVLSYSREWGWGSEIERARLLTQWAECVGEQTAEHTQVLSISHDVIQVQCDSTTWATELRRLRATILTRIHNEYPDAEIADIKFLAPGAPSWKHGPRTVRGRGPRDTYA